MVATSARPVYPHADAPASRCGELPVTKGRHAGKKLSECPVDFLTWLAANSASPTYRLAAAELLGVRADPPHVARTAPKRRKRKRRRGERPTVLTEAHVGELVGVIFKFAERDRLTERAHRLEEQLRTAGTSDDTSD